MTRALLVVVCLALVLLVVAGMRRGWRNRAASQAGLAPLPAVPSDLSDPLLASTGLYVGSSFASSWQDRVVHAGLGVRADGRAVLYPNGLLLERTGAAPVFIPRVNWVEARLAPGLAGKVTGSGGLLVLRWRLGGAELDTGFRADDKTAYPDWVRALNPKVDA